MSHDDYVDHLKEQADRANDEAIVAALEKGSVYTPEPEIVVLCRVIESLRPLTDEQCARVMGYICALFSVAKDPKSL